MLRCLPCEECVKLDDDLVDKDPTLRPLLEKFVRVRVVSTNGLDLSLFQFDYDQSFAVFLLNADGTVYGRFGTRSHRTNWVGDVSVDGLAKALQGALDLHAEYPKNKAALAAKRGPTPLFPVPEKFPTLGEVRPRTRLQGERRAELHPLPPGRRRDQVRVPREEGAAAGGRAVPVPAPEVTGLDPRPEGEGDGVERDEGFGRGESRASRPAIGSARSTANRCCRIADVQWVLHRASADGAALKAEIVRDGKPVSLAVTLPKGWRQTDDISWRSSAWGLRRMATGGMLLEQVEERPAGVPKDGMALRAKHVGQFGAARGGQERRLPDG